MKKTISLLLSLVFLCSFASVANAAPVATTAPSNATRQATNQATDDPIVFDIQEMIEMPAGVKVSLGDGITVVSYDNPVPRTSGLVASRNFYVYDSNVFGEFLALQVTMTITYTDGANCYIQSSNAYFSNVHNTWTAWWNNGQGEFAQSYHCYSMSAGRTVGYTRLWLFSALVGYMPGSGTTVQWGMGQY